MEREEAEVASNCLTIVAKGRMTVDIRGRELVLLLLPREQCSRTSCDATLEIQTESGRNSLVYFIVFGSEGDGGVSRASCFSKASIPLQ